jgi:beta-glucosidase
VLKGDWGYKGWVMSDWGAVHATDYASRAWTSSRASSWTTIWFGAPLKAAVEKGEVPAARLSDMSRRILRSMFAAGLFDRSAGKVRDRLRGQCRGQPEVAQRRHRPAEEPRRPVAAGQDRRTIAVIGGHADAGVLSGGGSSQVVPPGGAKVDHPAGRGGDDGRLPQPVFHPSSPLAAIRAEAPAPR